jgi:hypothetical protein
LRFDDTREVRADSVVLTDPRTGVVLAPGDDVLVSMSGALHSNDRAMLPAHDSSGSTSPSVRIDSITPMGGVDVCLEIDPHVVAGIGPGEYTGSVGVTGKDLYVGSTIPVIVTFRASHWLAAGFAFAGVMFGILVKVLTDLAAARRSGDTTPSAWEYVRTVEFAVTVILGAIGGWFAYTMLYDADRIWGDSAADWVKLFGTCFGFQLAGIGGIDLARRLMGAV